MSEHKHEWSEPYMTHSNDAYGYGTSYIAERCAGCGKSRAIPPGKRLTEAWKRIAGRDAALRDHR